MVDMKRQRTAWTMHSAEVAVFDHNAVALGHTINELMQAAAESLAVIAVEMLKQTCQDQQSCGSVCFLCGPGNNGGDGYAAALLLQQQGYKVTIIASSLEQYGKEAQAFRQQCLEQQDITLHVINEVGLQKGILQTTLGCCSLLVDCLIGAGFNGRALRGSIAYIIRLCLEQALPAILACDIPSGLVADASSAKGNVLPATITVTFHAPKLTMYSGSQLRLEVGQLRIAPLPWSEETTDCGPGEILRFPPLKNDARKGDRGRLLIVGGGPYYGAPLLSAQAAGRSGCDLVHLAMPLQEQAGNRAHWPLFLIPEQLYGKGYFDQNCCDYLLERCSEIDFDAVLIGPGLGRHTETIDAVWALLQYLVDKDCPLVIDADGLYVLAQKCPASWPQYQGRPMRGIITPHLGELQRWLGSHCPDNILNGILETHNAIDAEQQVILSSGSIDVLTGRGQRLALATGGHPRMATAGTGDLLAGVCASFLAQGMEPWPAARLATYSLRQAGKSAGAEIGIGLVADDLPFYIGKALQRNMAL